MSLNGIMLHCGAQEITEDALKTIPYPKAKGPKHFPVSHDTIWQTAKAYIGQQVQVMDQKIGVSKDGERMFGLMEIGYRSKDNDFTSMIGIRNSNDQSFAAGMVVGSRVFVCDNLSFSGEVTFARKHTRNILRDLPKRIMETTERIRGMVLDQQERFDTYKETPLDSQRDVDHVLMQMYRNGVIAPSAIAKVNKEWESPRHEEFEGRNVWSMFNAATEVLKGSNFMNMPARTRQLHNVCDLFSMGESETEYLVSSCGEIIGEVN